MDNVSSTPSSSDGAEPGRKCVAMHDNEGPLTRPQLYAPDILITTVGCSGHPCQQSEDARSFLAISRQNELRSKAEVGNEIIYRLIVLACEPDRMPDPGLLGQHQDRGNFDQLCSRPEYEYALPHIRTY
jgi:hypothetical protein